MQAGQATAPVLEVAGIHKRFPGVTALCDAGLRLFAGEVHALMGQNGAGKSTLIKVLTGVCTPDSGSIVLDGRAIAPRSPREAQAHGVSTVYQEVNLCPNLSVAENIAIGRSPRRFGIIRPGDRRALRTRAAGLLARLQVDIDVTRPLARYPLAIRQMVAIARALDVEAHVLILDEPTSSLDDAEVQTLFAVLRGLRDDGLAILFVTHFLEQAYAISDRITVLRNGEREGEYAAAALPRVALVGKMTGAPAPAQVQPLLEAEPAGAGARPGGTVFLRARGLARKGALAPLDLALRRGEVLGLAGLLGAGRTETARLLFGADRADAGSIAIDGRPVAFAHPRDAIAHGIGFCPEDRKHEGAFPDLSVRENVVLALQARLGFRRALSYRRQRQLASDYVERLGIRTAGIETPIGLLSGGNQQKVLLARWLATAPRLMILDEPTRGIDVRAKEEILEVVRDLCRRGMAILFISSELPEVLRMSDRMVVLRDRKACGEYERGALDETSVLRVIAGDAA